WRSPHETTHHLSEVDPETGNKRDIAALDHNVDAMGCSPTDNRLYARGYPKRVEHGHAPHLISITATGVSEDLGALTGPASRAEWLDGAFLGTVVDGDLVVVADKEIVSIDLTRGDRPG